MTGPVPDRADFAPGDAPLSAGIVADFLDCVALSCDPAGKSPDVAGTDARHAAAVVRRLAAELRDRNGERVVAEAAIAMATLYFHTRGHEVPPVGPHHIRHTRPARHSGASDGAR